MQNKKTIYTLLILALLIIAGLFWAFRSERSNNSLSKSGDILSARVERPNIIIETREVTGLEVFGLPTGTEVTMEDAVSLGRPVYVSENNGLQTWTLAIPAEPMLITNIFIKGVDRRDVAVKDYEMKEVGATELYYLLWGNPASGNGEVKNTINLKVGEEEKVAGLNIKLVKILEDSRCPVGVTCIWAGRVAVEFVLNDGKEEASKTMFSDEEKILEFGGYKVDLVSVKPNKVAGTTLEQSDYSVGFIITF